MLGALLGKKIGMTQLFDEAGRRIGVTVLQGGPCVVLQVRTAEKDGYRAVQLGFDDKKRKRARKPETGLAKKLNIEPKRFVREVAFSGPEAPQPGAVVTLEQCFKGVSSVDVIGTSKGRGFTGAVKRWNFHRGPMSHGSKHQRRPGSTGQHTWPARVWKGNRAPGRYGAERVTVRNLRVVRCDGEGHLLLVRGGVPGPNGSYVVIRRTAADRSKSG
jgi:large subunit ribosomal protein L3